MAASTSQIVAAVLPSVSGDYLVNGTATYGAGGFLECFDAAFNLSTSTSSPSFTAPYLTSVASAHIQNVAGTGHVKGGPSRPIVEVCSNANAASAFVGALTADQVQTVNGSASAKSKANTRTGHFAHRFRYGNLRDLSKAAKASNKL